MYQHEVLSQIKDDIMATMNQSLDMTEYIIKDTLMQKLIRAVVRIFSPML